MLYYCTTCNDSKINYCKLCIHNPNVMIFSSEAKLIYGLTNNDFSKLEHSHAYRANTMQWVKYFLDEIEEVAIEKLMTEPQRCSEVKRLSKLDKLLQLRKERKDYIERFVAIREELFILINKTFPEINVQMTEFEGTEIKINKKLFNLISKEAKSSCDENIFTCVGRIYELLRGDLDREWNRIKRLELVDGLLESAFGPKYELLKTELKYSELINVDIRDNQYINNFFQKEKNIIHLQKIIDSNDRKNKITTYINTEIKKQHRNHLLMSNYVDRYIRDGNDSNDWETVKTNLDNLVGVNKRNRTVEKYINFLIKKLNEDTYFNNYFSYADVYRNELVSKYIKEGDVELPLVKKHIKKALFEFLKKRLIYKYLESKKFRNNEELILENEIIKQFLDTSYDLNSIVLPHIIKKVIDEIITTYENEVLSMTATFVGNINSKSDRRNNILMIIETLKIVDENFNKKNIQKIYDNTQVKLFLSREVQRKEYWQIINSIVHRILKG